MDGETLSNWLVVGESQHTEFKEKYGSRVIESLVAFANTSGGNASAEEICNLTLRETPEVHEATQCTGAAWDDLDEVALRTIEQTEAFLRRNLRVARLLIDRGTHYEEQDVPEYPLAAAHEAVANAVAHRDYAASSQVFVRLYDNRLEIQNPGGWLPGLSLEQVLADGESRRRNPIIAEVLRQMGKMTTVGRGLVLIRQEMAALGSPAPEFASGGEHFRVTLPSRHVTLRSP